MLPTPALVLIFRQKNTGIIFVTIVGSFNLINFNSQFRSIRNANLEIQLLSRLGVSAN
jgi:hypothetical protein